VHLKASDKKTRVTPTLNNNARLNECGKHQNDEIKMARVFKNAVGLKPKATPAFNDITKFNAHRKQSNYLIIMVCADAKAFDLKTKGNSVFHDNAKSSQLKRSNIKITTFCAIEFAIYPISDGIH